LEAAPIAVPDAAALDVDDADVVLGSGVALLLLQATNAGTKHAAIIKRRIMCIGSFGVAGLGAGRAEVNQGRAGTQTEAG
jgi:hypothetical protein